MSTTVITLATETLTIEAPSAGKPLRHVAGDGRQVRLAGHKADHAADQRMRFCEALQFTARELLLQRRQTRAQSDQQPVTEKHERHEDEQRQER